MSLWIEWEYFSFDLADVESAIGFYEIYYGVHLLIDERAFVGDDGETYDSLYFAVVGFDLGDGEVVPRFDFADDALDDAAFVLERGYAI